MDPDLRRWPSRYGRWPCSPVIRVPAVRCERRGACRRAAGGSGRVQYTTRPGRRLPGMTDHRADQGSADSAVNMARTADPGVPRSAVIIAAAESASWNGFDSRSAASSRPPSWRRRTRWTAARPSDSRSRHGRHTGEVDPFIPVRPTDARRRVPRHTDATRPRRLVVDAWKVIRSPGPVLVREEVEDDGSPGQAVHRCRVRCARRIGDLSVGSPS